MGKIINFLKLFGINVETFGQSIVGIPKFLSDAREYKRQSHRSTSHFPLKRYYPVLNEASVQSGVATGHYFHQDLYVARRILEKAPRRHVDVASRVDGFVAHVAVFRDIDVVDIRSLATTAKHIRFIQADFMQPSVADKVGTSDSVSCLHALEHFGLGRYGDPISPDGYLDGLRNLCSLVEMGGVLYVSVPIGPQRVDFNAHRVFAAATIPGQMGAGFKLDRFSFVDDRGDLHEGVGFAEDDVRDNFGCTFGCGIFEFIRTS